MSSRRLGSRAKSLSDFARLIPLDAHHRHPADGRPPQGRHRGAPPRFGAPQVRQRSAPGLKRFAIKPTHHGRGFQLIHHREGLGPLHHDAGRQVHRLPAALPGFPSPSWYTSAPSRDASRAPAKPVIQLGCYAISWRGRQRLEERATTATSRSNCIWGTWSRRSLRCPCRFR